MTDRETLPVAAQETLRVPDRRLDAYYFAFDATGQPSIDAILSAVAHAGKGYHHTESWADEGPGWGGGLSYVDVIQAAAADAARERAALLDDLDRAEAEVKRLREDSEPAQGAEWDCFNFTEPVTCLSAGVTVTARCGRCRLRLTLAEETVRLAALADRVREGEA